MKLKKSFGNGAFFMSTSQVNPPCIISGGGIFTKKIE